MKIDGIWHHGRLWSAARIGVPAGTLFGLFQFALYEYPGKAIFGGIFFAVLFGAAMARIMWRSWPAAENLSGADRAIVVRCVARGENIEDPRLAPAVLDYASVIRHTQDRDRSYSWMLWIFAGLALILALSSSSGGSARIAATWWLLVAFWVGLLLWLPRKRARMLSRASRAEAAAKQLLLRPSAE